MPTSKLTERYVTLKEAADEAGVDLRTIHRWKKQGRVHEIRDRLGHVRVCLEDILACRPEQVDSPLVQQMKQLKAEVAALTHRLEQMETRLQEQIQQLDLGKQIVKALTDAQVAEDAPPLALSQLLAGISGSGRTQRSTRNDPLAKRGLPQGTVRLVDFAKDHQIKVHDLKRCYADKKVSLTIYHRTGEIERNQQEWWVTPSDVQSVLAYWQQQSWPFVTCSQCPHEGEGLWLLQVR